MPQTTITLASGPINFSLQKGDVVYYCEVVNQQSGKNHPNANVNTKPIRLGVVKGIDRSNLEITVDYIGVLPNLTGLYLFFIKDGVANHSGIIGAWLETEYRNYSTLSSEMFATAVDFVESSK